MSRTCPWRLLTLHSFNKTQLEGASLADHESFENEGHVEHERK